MTHYLHPAAQKGFSSAAELYQQARPDYPQDIVSWLKNELNLDQDSIVVDLGSGTGKFLPYLKQITPHIIAVEPVSEMLEQLKIVHPDVQTIQANSDEIPLKNEYVDAIVCAQSFHWFANAESLREIHRILKPQGHLGLIWNQRDEQVNWVKAIADLLAQYEGDTPRFHSDLWKNAFNSTEMQQCFDAPTLSTFNQLHTGLVEQVVSQRLLSTSFIAAMPSASQVQMKQQFEKLVYDYTGKQAQDEISFPYRTYAYHFQKLVGQ